MDTIGANLQAVRQRIAIAAQACGRNPEDIGLIAVSKTFGAAAVAVARKHGQTAFGESYAQEGVAKIATMADPAVTRCPRAVVRPSDDGEAIIEIRVTGEP